MRFCVRLSTPLRIPFGPAMWKRRNSGSFPGVRPLDIRNLIGEILILARKYGIFTKWKCGVITIKSLPAREAAPLQEIPKRDGEA